MNAWPSLTVPLAGRRTLADRAVPIILAVFALAASARPNIPLWPVPVTAQTLAVLLVGALLGPRSGALSVLAYLSAGAAGLPVFAQGSGVLYLIGPTGGYLMGFVPAAYLTGALIERSRVGGRRHDLLALLAGDAVIFAFGLAWLARFKQPGALPMAGLLPFLPGEIAKILLAGLVIRRVRS